jgi:O-antigen/teichoic acid export membrane protein
MFFVNVFIARVTSQDIYGQYALIRGLVNMIETTVSSSINPLVIKETSTDSDDVSLTRTAILLHAIIFNLIVVIVCSLFSNVIISMLDVSYNYFIIIIASFLIAVTIQNGILTSILISKGLFQKIFISSLVSFIIFFPIAFFTIEHFKVWGALVIFVVFNTFDFSLKLFLVKDSDLFKKLISWKEFQSISKKIFDSLAKTSSTLIIASLFNAVVFFSVRMILSGHEGGFAELANFDVSFQFIIIEMLILNTVTTVSLGQISKRINDGYSSGKLFVLNLAVVFVISIVMASICYVSAPFLLSLFGNEYNSEVLRLMSFITIFYAIAIVFNRYMIAQNKASVLLYVSVYSALAMYIYSLLNVNDAFDLTYSYIIYYAVSTLIYLYFIFQGLYFDRKTS